MEDNFIFEDDGMVEEEEDTQGNLTADEAEEIGDLVRNIEMELDRIKQLIGI